MDSKTGEEVSKGTYDSVFYATGRKADTSGIGLEAVGVKVSPSDVKHFWVVRVGLFWWWWWWHDRNETRRFGVAMPRRVCRSRGLVAPDLCVRRYEGRGLLKPSEGCVES